MKLMFFPVTNIDDLPHILLHYDFYRKRDRYFLSPYDVDISTHGSQKTVCRIIRSSNFLCALLNIDRETELKKIESTEPNTNPTEEPKSVEKSEQISIDDPILKMIEEKLDFKHRCVFYSMGAASDICGKSKNQIDFLQFRLSK